MVIPKEDFVDSFENKSRKVSNVRSGASQIELSALNQVRIIFVNAHNFSDHFMQAVE